MQHIFDIHDYDENFAERFCSHTIPIYDLWSVRPLQNQMKEMISGTAEEAEKFRNFLIDHSNKDYPHELVIVIGNAEKNNPGNMLNSTKKYFKLKFDKFKGNDLGQPLFMGAPQPYPTGQEQLLPLSFHGYGQRQQNGMNGFGGISYQDIQGIIDKNVGDATRSIRAEYEENAAKREADSIKRITELEMKMELYKLELRAREVEEKERKLQEELEELEERKAEGLGTVKEYTKTIAGGLLELGKSAFGLDEAEDKIKKSSKKKDKPEQHKREDLQGAENDLNDDGFVSRSEQKEDPQEAFAELMGIIKGLSVEERMQLMDVLIPEEIDDEYQENTEKTDNNEETESNNNLKLEENENISADNNN
jgi:hypothetical protein